MVRSCDYPWKAYHETSARSPVMTILDHDPAIMTLDDRFGDGEAQAGMTAKGFAFGPDAMEAVKDRLTRTLWNARPFILHARSEEHTSELQSLLRISYAGFCLKKNTINKHITRLL